MSHSVIAVARAKFHPYYVHFCSMRLSTVTASGGAIFLGWFPEFLLSNFAGRHWMLRTCSQRVCRCYGRARSECADAVDVLAEGVQVLWTCSLRQGCEMLWTCSMRQGSADAVDVLAAARVYRCCGRARCGKGVQMLWTWWLRQGCADEDPGVETWFWKV